jgi:YD repeat-containing protein
VTQRTNADGSTATAKYSGTKLQSKTDEEGRTTRFEWCPGCGGLQKLLAPLNYVLQWERNDDFDVTAFADANNNTTTYRYSGLGDLKEIRYPDDTFITYTQSYPLLTIGSNATPIPFFASNEVIEEKDGRNLPVKSYYGKQTGLLETKVWPGDVIDFSHDVRNRIISVYQETLGYKYYTYDSLNIADSATFFL